MSRKIVRGAAKAGTSAWEALPPHSPFQRRCFSLSPSRQATIINLNKSSDPKLNELLDTIKTQIFYPSYLPQHQQHQLFSVKWADKLKKDPIVMELDGRKVSLTHMDRMKLPSARRTFFAALDRMRTTYDFMNLSRLLEGLRNANRRLLPHDYVRMMRRAGDRGFIYTIIECARTVGRTGFRLDTSQKVNELLAYVQDKAVYSEWRDAAQALTWTEMIIEMLQDDLHKRRKFQEKGLGLYPLNRDAQVLAARLHMAAAFAVQYHKSEDRDGKVARYAREVVTLWPAGTGLLKLHPEAAYAEGEEMFYLTHPAKLIVMAAPLMHGMDMAMKVVEPELAAELKSRRDALDKEVQKALGETPKGRGREVYEKLYNRDEAEDKTAAPIDDAAA